MKRKILPITQNVRFRTYTYYSYYDAIVSNRFRTGKVAASININGFDEKKWEKKEQKLHIEHSGEGRLIFNADKYNLSMNALVYRTLKYVDEQTIEIYYQQNSQPWGSIGFFISDEVSFESDKYMHQIGRFCTGDLFYRNQQGQTNYYKSSKCIIQVKKNNKSISFWIYNEKKRRMELLKESEVNETKLYLGVYVFLYDNNYYEWVFNNYIQLKANKNATDIFLEFDNALKKDWKYFTTNYFVDYNISKLSFLMKLGIDVCKYIKRNIQSNNYVEMDIDYYDIIGTFYYRKQHYRHTCLFYGYDEVKEMFFVLCVDKNGHLKKCQIDYMSVFSELHDDSNLSLSENQDLIIVETYSPEHLPYVCSKESIGRSIKAFLQGASVICSGTILPDDNDYIYGVDIYDYFREHIDIVIRDIRITHLLLEHKECMIERIEYLSAKGFFEDSKVIELTASAVEIMRIAKKLRDYVLINSYSPRKSINELCEECFTKLKQLETVLMKQLFLLIESN